MAGKILIYSSFPPAKCGIGTYAADHVKSFKAQGARVLTCTVHQESAGNYRVNLHSIPSIFRTISKLLFQRFEAIHVHYTADFFFPVQSTNRSRSLRLRVSQMLLFLTVALKSGRRGSITFHEAYATPNRNKYFHSLKGFTFGLFRNLVFHTETERDRVVGAFPRFLSPNRAQVVEHTRFMEPRYHGTQAQAREELGIPKDRTLFLCIGFIQEHKGFHFAAQAAAKLDPKVHELHIVGSVRVPHPDYVAYRNRLAEQVDGIENVSLKESFVTDVDFDRWIKAADAVVLPYQDISSSGVGARAAILGTTLIYNADTNLKSQFVDHKKSLPYSSQAELETILAGIRHEDFTETPNPNDQSPNKLGTSPNASQKRMLFVMPWFGPTVKGGAESFIYRLCTQLKESGYDLEVWTTGTDSINKRNNKLLNGKTDSAANFPIKRFKTNRWTEFLFDYAHRKMNAPEGDTSAWGRLWSMTALTGKGMEAELRRQQDEFSSIHLCHYFAGSTHRLVKIAPQKTIVHPFIHNEPQARHAIMGRLFSMARGAVVNTSSEVEIATRGRIGMLPESFFPIGNGVDLLEKTKDDKEVRDNFWARHPQIVFVGRLIPDKNLKELLDWMVDYNKNRPPEARELRLVLIGEGPLKEDLFIRSQTWIEVRGWLDEEEKNQVIRESLALVQPSLLESFSLVVVESWALRTPVIVHAKCPATKSQVENSGGGIAVSDAPSFARAIEALTYYRDGGPLMGDSGYRYAQANFRWDQVAQKFLHARAKIMQFPTDNQKDDLPSDSTQRRYLVSNPEELAAPGPVFGLDGKVQRPILGQKEKEFILRCGGDFYKKFEDVFRDPKEEVVFPSFETYLDIAKGMRWDDIWVDVGAGRGSLLDYLAKNGMQHDQLFGVEPDAMSFFELYNKGYRCSSMNGDTFLKQVHLSSCRVISMLHVAEHIPWNDLCILFTYAYEALKGDGILIVETPNANSLKTAATNFWLDPTHIRPLVDETVKFAILNAGFQICDVHRFAPHFSPEKLDQISEESGSELITNELYGPQDLVLIARKLD